MSNQWQRAASEAAKRHQEYLAKVAAELHGSMGGADPVAQEDECDHPNGFGPNGCPCGASRPDELSDPAPTVRPMDDVKKGPWFAAAYSGECSMCFNRIEEGDEIRADGQGSYECSGCYPHEDEDPLPVVGLAEDPSQGVPTADEFLSGPKSPAVTLPTADEFLSGASDPRDELNVSGQPAARYEWRGKTNMGYLVKDPATGDFRRYKNGRPKGIVRMTTFNKAASDNKAIGDWGKRNVVMGASLRPDVLRRAHGLKHETDKAELDSIVAELETAAGAKVSADEGTYLHDFTEKIDAGLLTPDDAPKAYRADLKRYVEALAEAGLEPVPGLIERTIMIREFGGVVGKFDRIMFHRPSGTYVVVDLKTGKTMEYAMQETETQLWGYAHGINQNGVYDWNTDSWQKPDAPDHLPMLVKVREDVGIVIHMPVQGPLRGEVYVLHADLVAGAKHAELCHAIRTRPKAKVRLFEGLGEPESPKVVATWEELFAGADTNERASELWKSAKAAGISGVRLNALVALAQHAIKVRG